MSERFDLAVVQMRIEPEALDTNLARTVMLIGQAAAGGARLIVLPELCTSGYAFRDRAHAVAQGEVVPGGPSLAAWEAAARRLDVYIVGGLIEVADEALYNTTVLVGPEGFVGRYRKAHLFDAEKRLFCPGDEGFPVFETSLGRLAMLACFDLRFPESARAAALAGAEVLCVPTTWMSLSRPRPGDEHSDCMVHHLVQVHAYTNHYYIACADRIGQEGQSVYRGGSLIVDPSGAVIAGPASANCEEVLIASVEPARARDKRLGAESDLFGDRRPELYGLLTLDGVDHAVLADGTGVGAEEAPRLGRPFRRVPT